MPIVDDFLPDLAQAKVFSILDLKSGFWQVALDEQSSNLTTMGTLLRLFRIRRLRFGITPAPELFQRKLGEVLAHLAGVKAVVDDTLVYEKGDTIEAADR